MEKKVIKLTESDLVRIVKRVISEQQDNTNQPTGTNRVNPYVEKLKGCRKEYGMYQRGEDRTQTCKTMFQNIENGIFPKDKLILGCSADLLQQQQGIRSDGKDEAGFICCITDAARKIPRYS